ncbi:MAG TPA: right-handed parallel beta-helix repeat-containing protein [bacterium]|nr:right-handed parallel beta-helix repeat-containing protein [bacterium]
MIGHGQTRNAIVTILALSWVLALLVVTAEAGPTIGIYTGRESYVAGDTIEVSLAAQNEGEGMPVAVYVGLLTPDGGIYTTQFDGWSEGIEPWIPDIYVPPGFAMDRTPFWWFDLPCAMPPIQEPGEYNFAALLTWAGTLDWITGLSLAPFTVGASAGSHCYVDCEIGDDSNDGSEGSPWKTITHALASVEGSEAAPVTIHVAAGTYAASTSGETFPLNMKSWVSLIGEDPDTTVLDAEGAFHVICCDGVDNLAIWGLTLTGAHCVGGYENTRGGGIYCLNSSPTIENCIITENSIDGTMFIFGSAGISCRGGAPTIKGCLIAENRTNVMGLAGGGISCKESSVEILDNIVQANWAQGYGGGIAVRRGTARIEGNTIADNEGEANGGGLYCYGSITLTIADNAIVGNWARYTGGGMDISNVGSSTVIEGNILSDNYTEGGGGGVFCNTNCAATIRYNTISGNTADKDAGGIGCSGSSSPLIKDNVIKDNSAQRLGGGISCSRDSRATIEGNEIAGNWAGTSGGGIFCREDKSMIARNTIVGNTATEHGGGILCHMSYAIITENLVSDNSAIESGGGIHCEHGSVRLEGNVIAGNSGVNVGGGICSYYGTPTLRGNTIHYNSADRYGGGAYFVESTPTVEHNMIGGNIAGVSGGGIYCEKSSLTSLNNAIVENQAGVQGAGMIVKESTVSLGNWTVSRNSAPGGGVCCLDSSMTVLNSILWDNSSFEVMADNSWLGITYSLVEGGYEGVGNIHDDPMFVTGPLGEYYLDPDSLCIDAGSQSADDAGLWYRTTQADGTPDTGALDMGFHYPIP